MYVHELLRLIPSDTKQRVQRAFDANGRAVREAVGSLLRLSFTWRSRDESVERISSTSVSVSKLGLPAALAQLEIPMGHELSAILALWAPTLASLRDASSHIESLLHTPPPGLDRVVDPPAALSALRSANSLAETLLRECHADQFDLVQHVLRVDEDVLGTFSCRPTERGAPYESPRTGEVTLYWGALGLVAQALGVPVEALTLVVLAHEHGHAVTHLGFDRDGYRWRAEDFARTERSVHEALAQYCAARTAERLDRRLPGMSAAYQALLTKQSAIYRGHVPWLSEVSPEVLGATLAKIRPQGPATFDAISQELAWMSVEWQREGDA